MRWRCSSRRPNPAPKPKPGWTVCGCWPTGRRSSRRFGKPTRRVVTQPGSRGALDLLNQLNAHREFLPAAMALCNELAARLKASSVALGWRKGDYVRLKALSNVEHFAARVEMVRELEAAMEEAFDQDDEIVWPATEDSTSVARVHGQLSGRQSIPYLVSVPLRSHG